MTQDQIEVKAIKQICPKYDKSLHSKCKDPGKYGVKRTTQAEAAKKGCSVKKTENRKLPYRITVRLSQGEFGQLQQKISVLGVTAQDFARAAIRAAIKEIAPTAGTVETITKIKAYTNSVNQNTEAVK